MPKCRFCGGKILPANGKKTELCDECKLVLNDNIEDRTIGIIKEQLSNAVAEILVTKKRLFSDELSVIVREVLAEESATKERKIKRREIKHESDRYNSVDDFQA